MMKRSLFNAKSEFLVENFILFRTKAWNQALWGNSKNFLGHSITQDAWIPESSSKMEYSNSPSWRHIIQIHVDLFSEDMILIFQI